MTRSVKSRLWNDIVYHVEIRLELRFHVAPYNLSANCTVDEPVLMILTLTVIIYHHSQRTQATGWLLSPPAFTSSSGTFRGRPRRRRRLSVGRYFRVCFGSMSRIHRINGHGQPTRGDPPDWGLGYGLTILHHKRNSLLRNNTQGLGLGGGGFLWTR